MIICKKVLSIILAFSLLILTSCGTSQDFTPKDVQSVTLEIGGTNQETHLSAIFIKEDNIKAFFAIQEKLDQYDPKNSYETWKLDVKIQYHLKDGTVVNKIYPGIRPVDDYFKEIYKTKEYKEQTIPLFKLDQGEIKEV